MGIWHHPDIFETHTRSSVQIALKEQLHIGWDHFICGNLPLVGKVKFFLID